MAETFNFETAFCRNLGYVTEEELQKLRRAKIALPGMGGVGGSHLLTLTRLGIGRFHIADFDKFEMHNFNRQAGAMMSTIGQPKVEVMARLAKDINPELEITSFPNGVQPDNVDAFLDGVDVVVDGLDYFCFDAREMVFSEAYKRSIPVVTSGPIGVGAATMTFAPGKMTFSEYFRFSSAENDLEKAILLMIGIAPSLAQINHLVDRSRVDLAARKGPSLPMACQICAGSAATETMKFILKRGKIFPAPYTLQHDLYNHRLIRKWMPWGNANPIQRLRFFLLKRFLKRHVQSQIPQTSSEG